MLFFASGIHLSVGQATNSLQPSVLEASDMFICSVINVRGYKKGVFLVMFG